VDTPSNLSNTEKNNLEKKVKDEMKRVGYKAVEITEIDGYSAVITDVDLLGRDEIEVVNFHYLSEGEFFNKSCPLEVFYSL